MFSAIKGWWRRRSWVLKTVIIVGALIGIGMVSPEESSNSYGSSSDGNIDQGPRAAYSECESMVERQLKAPSTAEFSGYESELVKGAGQSRYRVTAWVDAENSFGATLRNDFQCLVDFDDGQKTLEYLRTR